MPTFCTPPESRVSTQCLWDSGELTVPATADPVGVIETIPVPEYRGHHW